MILEFDWNRGLFVARSTGPKKRSDMMEAVNRPNLTFAVSPKYLSNEILITRIPRGVYIIFLEFFKNVIFATSGRYLHTSTLRKLWNFLTRPGDKQDEGISNCPSTPQAGPSSRFSRFCRESHDFSTFLTTRLLMSWILGKYHSEMNVSSVE